MFPVVLLTFFCLLAGGSARISRNGVWESISPPTWNKSYTVNGTLRLPYAEIVEPFFSYFDAKNSLSRVDYYAGTVKTIQNPKGFGKAFKVAPMTTEKVLNVKTCFLVNGTKNARVHMQAVLPDTAGFKLVGRDVMYGGKQCDLWRRVTVNTTRSSTYTLWVEQENGHPVRYEMMGYDSLLGSHYDKYYIEYFHYTPQNLSPDVFNIEKVAPGLKCRGFPGPGEEDHLLLMNPIHEYVNHYSEHVDPMFHRFTRHHGKDYKGTEHTTRKDTFMHNLRFIHSHNRAGHSFTVAVNHLADWTDGERRSLRGLRPPKGYNGGLPFNEHKYINKYLPDHIDWRLFGAVTPVKDQAVCGSCWSFGTTGTVEGAYFLRTGSLVRLSQQELIDCSWGEGNNGCDGGEDFRAYQWIKKHGLATEDAYGTGNYMGQDGYCTAANSTSVVPTLKGYVNVTSGSEHALRVALSHNGPISVGIDASVKSFSFYSNGIYYDKKCKNGPDDLDHAVLAVGYGKISGQHYWLIKNSWSTYWGNAGYVLISQRRNNCGVTTAASYVLMGR